MDERKKNVIEGGLRDSDESTNRITIAPPPTPNRSVVRIVVITILLLLSVLFFGAILYLLSFLLFLLVLSIFFAYLLEPLVKAIRRPFKIRNLDRFMPRPLAIVVSYLIVFSVLAVTISYLAPIISAQIRDFAANLPNYANLVQEQLAAINRRYEQLMITKDLQEQISKNIGSFVEVTTVALTAFLGVVAVSVATYLPWILLIPVLAFFFLKDA